MHVTLSRATAVNSPRLVISILRLCLCQINASPSEQCPRAPSAPRSAGWIEPSECMRLGRRVSLTAHEAVRRVRGTVAGTAPRLSGLAHT